MQVRLLRALVQDARPHMLGGHAIFSDEAMALAESWQTRVTALDAWRATVTR